MSIIDYRSRFFLTVNDRVEEVRKSLNIKVAEFARKLDIKPNYYYEIRSGKKTVSKLIKKGLELHYNVNPDYLDNGEEPMFLEPRRPTIVREEISRWGYPLVVTKAIRELYELREDGIINEKQFVASRNSVLAQLERWGEYLEDPEDE